ncbi:hypothetical protein XaplCFBP3122_04595 [Xanthomonas arboricola pv. populi]|uniref:DUF2946 domain-containing protein n=1 Tax=Xanthomonas arboricola pv. populi TaxID=487823 RepID=A0A2S6Z884_9XANT|nr:DUF2946 family protein [Xanthomonas arboricola]PPT77923.1 hypothetical protein XaplCFBP3122_04595 [Xanthomonas arboricola pv. populi]
MRSLRRQPCLHLLACLAVLLMLVAPLISRWSQAPSLEPMCMSGPALDAGGSLHAGRQAMPAQTVAHRHAAAASPAKPHTGEHAATHGEACDYCVLAARLLPWLALLVLCLLQRRPAPAPVYRQARAASGVRWAALGARGPPLHA